MLTASGSSGFTKAPHQSQAKSPFPSGHILQGRPIDRSDPGRPAVPPSGKEHQAPERRRRGRSQRKSPRGNKRSQHPPTAHHLNPVPSRVPSAEQHPRSPEHPVSAHPPCSRKGPRLSACGRKSPWRVKREATISRFCGPLDSAKIPCGYPAPQTLYPPTRGRRLDDTTTSSRAAQGAGSGSRSRPVHVPTPASRFST